MEKLGERGEAAQAIQRALAIRPEAAGWHYKLAKLHQAAAENGDAGPLAAALGHFQRAAELEPDNALFAADLARALARDGDLHAAAEQFRRATDANRQDEKLWGERGQAHLALNDLKAAAACFGRALELAPAYPPALLGGEAVAIGERHFRGVAAARRRDPRLIGRDGAPRRGGREVVLARGRLDGLAHLGIGERQHPVAQGLIDGRKPVEPEDMDRPGATWCR